MRNHFFIKFYGISTVLLMTVCLFAPTASAAKRKKLDWPKKVQEEFIFECKEYVAIENHKGKSPDDICECALEKTAMAYSNPNVYKHDLLPRDYALQTRKDCSSKKKK